MACLGCNLIESAPVQLLDGTTVCSSCRDWLIECRERRLKATRMLETLPRSAILVQLSQMLELEESRMREELNRQRTAQTDGRLSTS